MTEDISPQQRFADMYQGQKPPWDIERPQRAFIEAADEVSGTVLDAGCGTGETALFFSERGHKVTGVDFVEGPILQARKKAEERRLKAEFLVQDALKLNELARQYDSIIDCGLFHVFAKEDRPRYVESLASVANPGARLFLMCFSEKEPGTDGPHRVSQDEIRAAFSSGWKVESIEEARFEVRPDFKDMQFSEGGPFAWFCRIRRE